MIHSIRQEIHARLASYGFSDHQNARALVRTAQDIPLESVLEERVNAGTD